MQHPGGEQVGEFPVALLASTAVGTRGSAPADLDDHLDLDRKVERDGCDADDGSDVPSGLAEHVDEEVRAGVDDVHVVGEVGGAVHHPGHPDHPDDLVEGPEVLPQGRQQAEAGESGGRTGLDEVEVLADPARDPRRVSALRPVAGASAQGGDMEWSIVSEGW